MGWGRRRTNHFEEIVLKPLDRQIQAKLAAERAGVTPSVHIAATWQAGTWCCPEHAFGPIREPQAEESR
jgi:hypothetical protein